MRHTYKIPHTLILFKKEEILMKRNIRLLFFALLILTSAFFIVNCTGGSSGGGGGGIDIPSFNWDCTEAPSYNVDLSSWKIQDTKCETSNCPECNKNTIYGSIEMTGANSFLFHVDSEEHPGRICGDKFIIEGTTYLDTEGCPCGNDIKIVGILSSSTKATAYTKWACDYCYDNCNGKSEATATRL
jgi:hypothetical protein